ncbi:PLP-dependent aminotransferase family protein [Variovorax sp.]|jgi:GntR family transcriptional regulator/MocR family aminotransferase|uniref:MocR-like pyridoxine biosynthesis transcription factor PdxR n=1 Tax=Variovorax sp. TaxID=1871043 RepID=UPI0037D9E252
MTDAADPSATLSDPVRRALLEAPLVREREAGSMQRQLHERLKRAILDGRLAPGTRLPGSRALAEALAVSRNTVTATYEHLAAEGYLRPDRQGTRVMELAAPAPPRRGPRTPAVPATAGRLARIHPMGSRAEPELALRPGVPALSHFPIAAWRGALDRALRGAGHAALGYGNPFGEPALRAAIAQHLGLARGVRCTAEQVVIAEGAQEAIALCVRLLTDPGDTAWVEDPGYRGAKSAMHAGDLRIVPMPVDAGGLRASEEDWRLQTPRLVYATPSHQYPSGVVLGIARRLALIAQARAHGAWIIEDDYDSEFRHTGDPIAAMQGLVPQAPVLYVGTFSKTMFPSLRLGFLVLPEDLLATVRAPLEEMLRGGHRHEQLALADFIESGQFSRHLGRMRRLYRERQQALRAALERHFRLPHTIDGGHCGMHLTVRLPARFDDRRIAAEARRHRMAPMPLSAAAIRPGPDCNGLVLGYGNTSAELFEPMAKRLAQLARVAGR